MDRYSPIALRIQQLRKAQGLSQYELGLRAGFPESTASGRMNHYEKGNRIPDLATLEKIAESLGVPVGSLFFKDSDMFELVCLASELTPTQRADLIAKLKQELQK